MAKQTMKSLYPAHVWQGWSKQAHGPVPTEGQLAIAHVFGRPGKQALGIAQALRDAGITEAQMRGASALFDGKNTTCRNKMVGKGGLVECGFFNREPVKGAIKLTLTAAGVAHIAKYGSGDACKAAGTTPATATVEVTPAKPDKAPAKAKAKRKAKAKAPASDATVAGDAPVEPVEGDTSTVPAEATGDAPNAN